MFISANGRLGVSGCNHLFEIKLSFAKLQIQNNRSLDPVWSSIKETRMMYIHFWSIPNAGCTVKQFRAKEHTSHFTSHVYKKHITQTNTQSSILVHRYHLGDLSFKVFSFWWAMFEWDIQGTRKPTKTIQHWIWLGMFFFFFLRLDPKMMVCPHCFLLKPNQKGYLRKFTNPINLLEGIFGHFCLCFGTETAAIQCKECNRLLAFGL